MKTRMSKLFKKRSCTLISLLMISFLVGEARVVAALSSMKGNVQIRSAGVRKYEPAYKGQMIKTGDWLKTDLNVFAAIIFLDGSNIKIRSKTEIEIKSSRVAAKQLNTMMYISEGQVWSKVTKQNNSEFEIKTPTAIASVKGTEFNIDFDDLEESTTLTVIEGEVLFGNDLSSVLAGAMEGASASKEEAPEKYKIEVQDLPQWQNNTDPSWGFKLTPNTTGKQPINKSVKVSIQIINTKTKEPDNKYNNEVQVNTESELLFISKDGSSWSNAINILLKDGRGTVHIKGVDAGKPHIVVSTENSESNRLSFEFYISKNQQNIMNNKLAIIAEKKGLSDVSQFIAGRSLKSTAVTLGVANISDMLQKVDTGEFEILNTKQVENPDGTRSVVLTVKSKGNN